MYSTEGIILKRTDTGEADALFTIYTKQFGKIRARAQGVKKENAKLKGHLEPLHLSAVQFVLGKSGERLTHASLLYSWPSIRETYEKLALASYMVALVDTHCFPGEQDEKLWELLVRSFHSLEAGNYEESAYHAFRETFERELTSAMGYGTGGEQQLLEERVAHPFLPQ